MSTRRTSNRRAMTRARAGLTSGTASLLAACAAMVLLALSPASALAASLTGLDYAALSGDRVRLTLQFDGAAPEPRSFRTMDPARIALDFEGVTNALETRRTSVGVGAVDSIGAASAGNRTRIVVNLSRMVPYEVSTSGNTARILLASPRMAATGDSQSGATDGARTAEAAESGGDSAGDADGGSIDNMDFQRGEDGAGQVIVGLTDPGTPVNVERQGNKVIADFVGTKVPEQLRRRLDVSDFATPVSTIETRQRDGSTRVTIEAGDDFEQIAYQTDQAFTIELKPLTETDDEETSPRKPQYTGERLSLNFQDIEVRSVLQLLADFTGLNMVVSDSVTGNITLRLDDVPWDQALDIILQAKGLDKRRNGNVMWVAPATEIAERERIQAEAMQQQAELAPLRSEFIQINYAKAADLANLIRGDQGQSLLSERGNLAIDQRTNTLIVQDTVANIEEIRSLVNRLDVPVRQVLIESRVVIADDSFARDLGVQFGLSTRGEVGNTGVITGGTQGGGPDFAGGQTGFAPGGTSNDALLVDLPSATSGASLGLAVGQIGSELLQLELSAMEEENRGEVISTPKVITSNQKEAFIKQGEEIPFEEATSSGATNISFKEAVLGLTVTPQITPDDRILLDLEVSKDSRGQTTSSGVPAIDTQAVGTQVLVDNGETIVLGGVYERTKRNDVRRVPFFGSLPIVGNLFRNRSRIDENRELLIFVTPKIVKESLALDR